VECYLLYDADAIISPANGIFSFVLVLWAYALMVTWKKKEAVTAVHWGMSDYENIEVM